MERKRSLRRLIPAGCEAVFYVDHIEGEGERLFELVCERDLEGTSQASAEQVLHGEAKSRLGQD